MYASEVKNRKLTFVVSGQLWNRSLVMMDQETRSQWSHILGECVDGKLKGTELKVLVSDMLTWDAWKKEHPATTVLNLRRSARGFNRDMYRQPERFVVGLSGGFGHRHVSFSTLRETPLMNVEVGDLPLLILADPDSTSVRVFERKVGKRVLTFERVGKNLRDVETESLWNSRSGVAIEGPFNKSCLVPQPAIVSFARAWKTFHPDSQPLGAATGR